MVKLWHILAGVGILLFSGDRKKKTEKVGGDGIRPANIGFRNIFEVQEKYGFVPVSIATKLQKKLTGREAAKIRIYLRRWLKKYGLEKTVRAEKLMRVETSHFRSLLFETTRNVGGILCGGFPQCITFFVVETPERNYITDSPKKGKPFRYRYYGDITEALADFEEIFFEKHGGSIWEFAGRPADKYGFLKIYQNVKPRFLIEIGVTAEQLKNVSVE